MPITLNHTIIPAHDKVVSAQFFAHIFGLSYEGTAGHFAPVQVNESLTLDFDNSDHFESHHYAFHIGDEEFDAILGRIKKDEIPFGSGPFNPDNAEINTRGEGRGFYFKDPNGHLLEVLTRT